jgi:hypothetical protein
LHDGRDEAIRIELQLVVKAHAPGISPQRYEGTTLKLQQTWRPCVLVVNSSAGT